MRAKIPFFFFSLGGTLKLMMFWVGSAAELGSDESNEVECHDSS